ncbi:MAG: RHS repeat domain-containing protein [Planctomycetota bacterium]
MNLTGAFCCNHQYSVTAITTSTGAIDERYAYTAYGQPTILNASGTPLSPQSSTLNSRYSYTGREWDATLGLHHFRARWMSPSAGRFLGRDPIGYVDGGYSLPEYLSDNPLNRKDPSGEDWWDWPWNWRFPWSGPPKVPPVGPPVDPPVLNGPHKWPPLPIDGPCSKYAQWSARIKLGLQGLSKDLVCALLDRQIQYWAAKPSKTPSEKALLEALLAEYAALGCKRVAPIPFD